MIEWIESQGLSGAVAIVIVAALSGLLYLSRWMGSTSSDVKNHKAILDNLSLTVGEIKDNVNRIMWTVLPAQGGYTGPGSPTELTAKGEKLAQYIGAQRWAEQLAPKLADEIGGMEDFEVDAFCSKYVQTRLNAQEERKVSEAAYRFGTDPIPVKMVMVVVLRETLLRHR